MTHLSSCAVHNEPAYPAGPCDCGEWAEEIVENIWAAARNNGTLKKRAMAHALLKARADGERFGRAKGMREAAEIAKTARKGGPVTAMPGEILVGWALGDALDAAKAIIARAEAIERGE